MAFPRTPILWWVLMCLLCQMFTTTVQAFPRSTMTGLVRSVDVQHTIHSLCRTSRQSWDFAKKMFQCLETPKEGYLYVLPRHALEALASVGQKACPSSKRTCTRQCAHVARDGPWVPDEDNFFSRTCGALCNILQDACYDDLPKAPIIASLKVVTPEEMAARRAGEVVNFTIEATTSDLQVEAPFEVIPSSEILVTSASSAGIVDPLTSPGPDSVETESASFIPIVGDSGAEENVVVDGILRGLESQLNDAVGDEPVAVAIQETTTAPWHVSSLADRSVLTDIASRIVEVTTPTEAGTEPHPTTLEEGPAAAVDEYFASEHAIVDVEAPSPSPVEMLITEGPVALIEAATIDLRQVPIEAVTEPSAVTAADDARPFAIVDVGLVNPEAAASLSVSEDAPSSKRVAELTTVELQYNVPVTAAYEGVVKKEPTVDLEAGSGKGFDPRPTSAGEDPTSKAGSVKITPMTPSVVHQNSIEATKSHPSPARPTRSAGVPVATRRPTSADTDDDHDDETCPAPDVIWFRQDHFDEIRRHSPYGMSPLKSNRRKDRASWWWKNRHRYGYVLSTNPYGRKQEGFWGRWKSKAIALTEAATRTTVVAAFFGVIVDDYQSLASVWRRDELFIALVRLFVVGCMSVFVTAKCIGKMRNARRRIGTSRRRQNRLRVAVASDHGHESSRARPSSSLRGADADSLRTATATRTSLGTKSPVAAVGCEQGLISSPPSFTSDTASSSVSSRSKKGRRSLESSSRTSSRESRAARVRACGRVRVGDEPSTAPTRAGVAAPDLHVPATLRACCHRISNTTRSSRRRRKWQLGLQNRLECLHALLDVVVRVAGDEKVENDLGRPTEPSTPRGGDGNGEPSIDGGNNAQEASSRRHRSRSRRVPRAHPSSRSPSPGRSSRRTPSPEPALQQAAGSQYHINVGIEQERKGSEPVPAKESSHTRDPRSVSAPSTAAAVNDQRGTLNDPRGRDRRVSGESLPYRSTPLPGHLHPRSSFPEPAPQSAPVAQGTTRHDREERGRRLEVVPAQPPPLMKYTAESGFLPPVCVPEYVSSSYNPVGSMFDPPLPKRDLLSAMSEIGFPDRVLRAITLDKVDTSTMSSLLRDLRAAKATRVFNERGRRFIGPKPSCYPSYMSGEGMAHLLGKVSSRYTVGTRFVVCFYDSSAACAHAITGALVPAATLPAPTRVATTTAAPSTVPSPFVTSSLTATTEAVTAATAATSAIVTATNGASITVANYSGNTPAATTIVATDPAVPSPTPTLAAATTVTAIPTAIPVPPPADTSSGTNMVVAAATATTDTTAPATAVAVAVPPQVGTSWATTTADTVTTAATTTAAAPATVLPPVATSSACATAVGVTTPTAPTATTAATAAAIIVAMSRRSKRHRRKWRAVERPPPPPSPCPPPDPIEPVIFEDSSEPSGRLVGRADVSGGWAKALTVGEWERVYGKYTAGSSLSAWVFGANKMKREKGIAVATRKGRVIVVPP